MDSLADTKEGISSFPGLASSLLSLAGIGSNNEAQSSTHVVPDEDSHHQAAVSSGNKLTRLMLIERSGHSLSRASSGLPHAHSPMASPSGKSIYSKRRSVDLDASALPRISSYSSPTAASLQARMGALPLPVRQPN